MATLTCPHCGAALTTRDGWARATIATLAQSPAVPAMANQTRCTQCGRLVVGLAGGSRLGWRAAWPAVALVVLLALVAAFA